MTMLTETERRKKKMARAKYIEVAIYVLIAFVIVAFISLFFS